MRALAGLAITTLLLVGTSGVCQSLADLARENRSSSRPRAKRVITNDDVPAVVEIAPKTDSKAETSQSDSGKPETSKKDAAKAEEKALRKEVQRLREQADINDKLARQQDKVSLLDREVKLAQREHERQTLLHNYDVNALVNGQAQWNASEKQYNQDMAEKQEVLTAERDKLTALQEDARRLAETTPE